MNIAIMLSGGVGSRVGGDIPKQYIKVCDKRLIYYSLESMINSEYIDKICIVAAAEWVEILKSEISDKGLKKIIGFAKPGENRQLSILSGMNFIKDSIQSLADNDLVFIHDAARPYLTEEMIKKYIESIEEHDGVIPVLPMKDTVYLSKDGKVISSLIDRNTLYAGQAPEVFKFNKYYEANIRLLPDKIKAINGSTEPAILAGMSILMVAGEEKNVKVTTENDLYMKCI